MKRQICNYVGAGLMALSFMNFISCTEIEHGVNDIDTWEEVKDYTPELSHPCMLHTQADFDFVKGKLKPTNSRGQMLMPICKQLLMLRPAV